MNTGASSLAAASLGGETSNWVERLADGVVCALIDEAQLTPKPGLVDSRGNGSHSDLNLSLMRLSAKTLRPYFLSMARAGTQIEQIAVLRRVIGAQGREAEAAMLRATSGVNTHRGAIWSLGLLITAAARAGCRRGGPGWRAGTVASLAGALARCPDPAAPVHTGNKGEAARRRYRVGGAVAQAQAGFPLVTNTALPQLYRSRKAGQPEDAARLNALLAVMAQLDDTCLLSRGGRQALAAMQARAAAVLAMGGTGSPAGRRALQGLHDYALSQGLSPGGAADLLAAALFLDQLTKAAFPKPTMWEQTWKQCHSRTRQLVWQPAVP
ncbi:MAG TPA: triphosphoribosyl-dephospho-CoA synthase [Pusillimonas sp.]|uniref:triphosphoribosyl-dephospho-CoA synthase n=1 Tax=Pusillimonas sp. TaxID=3040095 RepID=UPI002CB1BB56|nr:triphosphoribosyl-dephospho-CoA synthase [Pusillimonas sp.]HUH89017.1 triphosphoribosyl-dephospho-CoA synthase [Pusillimonas sp.]